MNFKTFLFAGSMIILTYFSAGAQDIHGSSDHVYFKRIPGFSIRQYIVEEIGSQPFFDENNHKVIIEGKKTYLYYECDCEESPLKIIRNFSNDIRKLGGKSLEYSDNKVYMKLNLEGLGIWAEVVAGEYYYYLTIVEKSDDKQASSPGAFQEDLN